MKVRRIVANIFATGFVVVLVGWWTSALVKALNHIGLVLFSQGIIQVSLTVLELLVWTLVLIFLVWLWWGGE